MNLPGQELLAGFLGGRGAQPGPSPEVSVTAVSTRSRVELEMRSTPLAGMQSLLRSVRTQPTRVLNKVLKVCRGNRIALYRAGYEHGRRLF